MSEVSLGEFRSVGLDRGRGRIVEMAWYLTKGIFFLSWLPWPSRLKSALLRLFGAEVGKGCVFRPRINIHFPWKLALGDNCWVGEGSTILNLEPVRIDHDTALAHEVYIAAAGHDISSRTFGYANAPVHIESYCWLASRVLVSGGTVIKEGTVCTAGAVVVSDVGPWQVCGGVPARSLGQRRIIR